MAIAHGKQREVMEGIRNIYANAETAILERIAALTMDGPADIDHWTSKKLGDIRRNMDQVDRVIKQLEKTTDNDVTSAITQAYINGSNGVDAELADAGMTTAFGTINRAAVQALASAATNALRQSHLQILRSANDAYRTVITDTASLVSTGTMTRQQATQVALNRMADRGISGFIDAKGRKWELASYAEMAIRSSVVQASVQGHVDRMAQMGHDLVIVSDHLEECALCRPWEGKVLSTSGMSADHPSLVQATSAGLFHPGCGHTVGIYIEGVTEIPTKTADPDGYALRQQQRANERQIRKWKKRQSVAKLPSEQQAAKLKVQQWQKAQREFVAKHDRHRNYAREQIKGGKVGVSPEPSHKPPVLTGDVGHDTLGTSNMQQEIGYPMVGNDAINQYNKKAPSRIASFAERYGMTPENYKEMADKRVSDMIADAKIAIRAPFNVVETIINDGRFKSQFETKTSGGIVNSAKRKKTEEYMFGAPQKLDKTKRPIYGYLDNESTVGQASWYGEIKFVMKNDLRNRTTFTFGDSMTAYDHMKYSPASPAMLTNPSGQVYAFDILEKRSLGELGSYAEVQIHGGVTLADIEAIEVDIGDMTSSKIKHIKDLLQGTHIRLDIVDR